MTDADRPSAMLTPTQRTYLWDDSDIDSSSSRDRAIRGRIRDRLRNAILDFDVIRLLPAKDRRDVFDAMEYGDDLYRGLREMIAFVYQVTQDAGIDFEELLADGVKQGTVHVSDEGELLTDVSVDIQKEWSDILEMDEIARRFLEGEELTHEELGALVAHVRADEDTDYLKQRVADTFENLP